MSGYGPRPDFSGAMYVECRSYTLQVLSAERDQDVDISDVVASASERLLEENAFYMRLKLIVRERMAELNELQETVANQRKEIEALKIRCDTYRCVHPDTICDFSLIDVIDPGR